MPTYPHDFSTYPAGNFQSQDWMDNWVTAGKAGNIICSVGGTANAITLTPVSTAPLQFTITTAALQTGMLFWFVATASNSAATTITVGSATAFAVYDTAGNAITSGILSGLLYAVYFDQTLNSGVGGYRLIGLSSSSGGGGSNQRMVTAAGDVTVLATDQTILMNKTVGAPTNINLPVAATRNGVPLLVKDYKGDANTNNITFVPNGTETIDGLSPAAAITAGVALIDINNDKKLITPLLSGGGWFT